MTSYSKRALLAGACILATVASAGVAAGAPAPHASKAAASTPGTLNPQTVTDLGASMRGEAFAHASYMLFADQATHEGLPAVARLYQNTAHVELHEHFTEEAALTGLVGSDQANLRTAINGESYESATMYPTFSRQARQDGDANAADLFAEIAKDEGKHRDAFKAALAVITTGKGQIPAPPTADAVKVVAGPPKVSAARTKANLDTAIHGEALAHAKYVLFAEHAQKSGRAALAKLFMGAAQVELREHLAGEADLAGLVGTTRPNLERTVKGETYKATQMYPAFAKRAQAVGDKEAARLFTHNAMDEAKHAAAFEKALKQLP
ncbi:ferritin family protein [Streptacidiphilus griseoplanus]|uniref:ferritin family protein n=1 Tax=Peterkaempfera griseoplana TaxID=66896 RepID=UPI000A99C740|nr:ferritin family protein [Peterkaempfera griseoplana]